MDEFENKSTSSPDVGQVSLPGCWCRPNCRTNWSSPTYRASPQSNCGPSSRFVAPSPVSAPASDWPQLDVLGSFTPLHFLAKIVNLKTSSPPIRLDVRAPSFKSYWRLDYCMRQPALCVELNHEVREALINCWVSRTESGFCRAAQ